MDYSEDMNSATTGGDLGYVPESSLNQSDPMLKKIVMSLKPGQVSPPIVLKDSIRILKLVTREAPGLRGLADPQVQQNHPRHAAQPQGTVAPGRVSRRRSRRRTSPATISPSKSSNPTASSRPPRSLPLPAKPVVPQN